MAGGRPPRKVRCVETGVVYNSIAEAAKLHNVATPALHQALNGHTASCAGYRWRYAENQEETDVEQVIKVKDGVMPMDDDYFIHRDSWVKNPQYTLYKKSTPLESYDCLQTAMAAYRKLKRGALKRDTDTLRRMNSYTNEWEPPRG